MSECTQASQYRVQSIRAAFINSKKLPARLDHLFGPGNYNCRWHMNHYLIHAPRKLEEVNYSL
jgi:hypothetical protein